MKTEYIDRYVARHWIIFCFVLLLLLLSVEFFSYRLFNLLSLGERPPLSAWLIPAILLILFLVSVIVGIQKGAFARRPTFQLISDIVHNVSRSHPIAIAILLVFTVNVGLFCNTLNAVLCVSGYEDAFWWSMCKCMCPILVTFGSFYLYPKGMEAKPGKDRSLLVCGLSKSRGYCSPMNIDLLCKPFKENYGIKTMVIIPSSGSEIHFKEAEETGNIFQSDECLGRYNDIIREYESQDGEKDAGKTIRDLMLCQLGKEIDFEVIVGKQVDYDNYEELLQHIESVLDKYERRRTGRRETNETLLYINPGTVAIGSMLSVFSIPGERSVLYFTQTQNKDHLVDYGLKTKGMDSIIQEYSERI